MKHMKFTSAPEEKHDCIGHQDGDWVIFTCPECDYQRHFNWQTGKMKTFNDTIHIAHSGFHAPVLTNVEEVNQN